MVCVICLWGASEAGRVAREPQYWHTGSIKDGRGLSEWFDEQSGVLLHILLSRLS